jgi:hypothetical protein
VLGLIVLRAMIIESPHIDQPQTRMFLSSEIVSLLISTVLLVCVGLWLFVSILCNRFRWRKTGFGIAVCVFIFAGVVSAVFASDKRAAVTDLITLATPMVGALLLVQLLTSTVRIRLALLLILSVGVAATIQCVVLLSMKLILWSFFKSRASSRTAWNTGCMSTGSIPKIFVGF